ncbi:MAG: hypothetical protein KDI56_15765 [Xanthomonadales bacterium]|nr:hypothetical protein [Xanthomonadales bacterium]
MIIAGIALGGLSPAATVFSGLARRLSGRRLVMLDPVVYERTDCADVIERELQWLDLQFADAPGAGWPLVGYSAGASLALLYALRRPERVNQLHLLEPPWLGNAPSQSPAVDLLQRLDGRFVQACASDFLPAFVRSLMADGEHPSMPNNLPPAEWMRARPPRAVSLWRALRQHPLQVPQLRSLTIPLHLYQAGRSHPGFAAHTNCLQAAVPQARSHDWPDADHFDLPQWAEATLLSLLSDSALA